MKKGGETAEEGREGGGRKEKECVESLCREYG